MQVTFVFDVDFLNVAGVPYKENCDKCAFPRPLCAVMGRHNICGYGKIGYFVLNKIARKE